MMAIRQRNDPVRVFGRRLLMLGLFALVSVLAFGMWNAYRKEGESMALRIEAETQLKDYTDRRDQLNEDIADLQTDRGVEAVLREQYALAARGEKLIVIVDQPVATPTQATSTVFDKIRGAFLWW
ncbi:MAG: hypothetical protein AAB804_00445 [Patescibacteria group bacterium]